MSDENREINFPLPSEDDTDAELSTSAMRQTISSIKNVLEHIVGGLAHSINIAHELASAIQPTLESFAKMAQNLSFSTKPIVDALQQMVQLFLSVIAEIQIPTITEERKQELIDSYTQWGKYGWTRCPNAPIDCFDEIPTSIGEANAVMTQLCSKREMEQLFDELHRQRIKKEDLDAAILCYNNQQYKACALILFGIIDAKLIRKQKRGKKNRPSGSTAAQKLREQFEGSDNEKKLLDVLFCVNLFTCLETLFAGAKDFKFEPATINRNFVSHGMTRRPVRQRDCIQLFLALYNLMLLFEFAP